MLSLTRAARTRGSTLSWTQAIKALSFFLDQAQIIGRRLVDKEISLKSMNYNAHVYLSWSILRSGIKVE